MPTQIDIVISAHDAFAPAFDRLDEAFGRARALAGQAQQALDGMGTTLTGMGQAAGAAETAVQDFVEQTNERLAALAEERQAVLEEMGTQQEAFSRSLEERLLAIDEEMAARRQEIREQAQARRLQAQAAYDQALVTQETATGQRLADVEAAALKRRLELYQWFYGAITELARSQGGALARLAQSLGVARALIDAYVAANDALASVPYPLNLAAAALVLAQGLANVERIRQVNVAHGGIGQVPEDATFLLRQGERVLSPAQNRDLTDFLGRAAEPAQPAGVSIGNLTIHVLENATSAEALLRMEPSELRRVVGERIVPMLDELARLGIRPQFVGANT